jgi:hypothetical protein
MPGFTPTLDELPQTIPIFPLSGCILLPCARLPLNIFEPRYLEMCRDAMAGPRVIGMVQPVDPCDARASPPVYGTGCAGRITAFKETDDGRFLITLTGLCRFRIAEELPQIKRYRTVAADYRGFAGDLERHGACELDRARLMPALKSYLERHGLSADWGAIEKCPSASLVNSLAMVCPFSPSEKQALLEAQDHDRRAELFLSLLEISRHEPAAAPRGPCH